MKKLILIFAAVFLGMTVNAQKNTLLVGGNVSYTSENIVMTDVAGLPKVKTFEFNPTVGYQFSDKWLAGINVGIASRNQGLGHKSNSFAVGPFIRYIQPLSETFSVYGDLGLGFQNVKYKYNIGLPELAENKGNGFYVGFTPAVFINLKNSFGLNFNFGGVGYNNIELGGVDSNQFDFNFGKTINIGISKNFKM